MNKIAIFSSGGGEAAERVISLSDGEDRIRVELVVTDRENAEIIERLKPLGVNVTFIPRERWREAPDELLSLLGEGGVELIAFDDFRGYLPPEIAERYAGKILTLSSPEEAPREVVAALEHRVETPAQSAVPTSEQTEEESEPQKQDEPKTVDEEWADTLKMEFDKTRLRSTPPPIPDTNEMNAPHPAGFGPTQGYGYNQHSAATGPNSGYAQHPYAVRQEPGEPIPPNYMLWSVLATVFCCLIPGIVAIIFSSQVTSRYITGDIEGARRASQRAQIWIIVSFVLGLLSATLYLPLMMIS